VDSLDSFLAHRIEKLVAAQSAPIDLQAVATECGVLAIEQREMIPEAVMTPDRAGFHIYLQSNFAHASGARIRQRFSLAHEIAHTLFFERRDGAMKPLRGAPTGHRLEAACHKGAGLLLVPDRLLRSALKTAPQPLSAEYMLGFARDFEVSVEVIIRRLNQVEAFGNRFAPVLLRRHQKDGFTIEYAVYPAWLKAILPTPRRGMDFTRWFGAGKNQAANAPEQGGSTLGPARLTRRTPQGLLIAHPVDITLSLRIVELRLE